MNHLPLLIKNVKYTLTAIASNQYTISVLLIYPVSKSIAYSLSNSGSIRVFFSKELIPIFCL